MLQIARIFGSLCLIRWRYSIISAAFDSRNFPEIVLVFALDVANTLSVSPRFCFGESFLVVAATISYLYLVHDVIGNSAGFFCAVLMNSDWSLNLDRAQDDTGRRCVACYFQVFRGLSRLISTLEIVLY